MRETKRQYRQRKEARETAWTGAVEAVAEFLVLGGAASGDGARRTANRKEPARDLLPAPISAKEPNFDVSRFRVSALRWI